MSLASKVTFTLCCATTLGTVFYVHYRQEEDRKQLHQGVERDIERQKNRKVKNSYMLEQQSYLKEQLGEANSVENYPAA